MRRQEAEISCYYAEYLRLSTLCKAEAGDFVITHGDAPGNVLVRSSEDIYLIDWDNVLLAPPERDMWIMDHFPEFLDGYQSARHHYAASANMRSFFIYKYYFSAMIYYFAEILGAVRLRLSLEPSPRT